jgi:polysaccharide export outer membrane protein
MNRKALHLAAIAFTIAAFAAAPALAYADSQLQQSAQSAQTDAYKINPGDQISIQVYGEPTLSQTIAVLDDGTIEYPMIGRVKVAGKTPTEASDAIKSGLLKYIKHPMVTVALAAAGQNNVLVLGNVKTPGKYVVRSGAHVSDAIAAAGGLGATNGDYPEARITQASGTSRVVSLQKLLVSGDSSQNASLGNNAIVYVLGPLPIRVQVLGAVDKPGYYELHQGDRLSAAIAQAGSSVNAKSDLNHVFITRDVNGKAEKQEINMYNALKEADRRSDPVLQKDDVVYVPQARQPSQFNPLTLLGRLIGVGL